MHIDLRVIDIVELLDKDIKVTLMNVFKKIEEKWRISSKKQWEPSRGYEVLVIFNILIYMVINYAL